MKPPWVKSNLPTNIKVKFWDIMRQTNTYPNLCVYFTKHADLLTDYEWQQVGTTRDAFVKNPKSTITRDTYKALKEEIRAMPLRELAHLPGGIQNWARGLKGDMQLQHSIESLIRSQEEHWEALANAAKRLADNLKPYLQEASGCLGDYVIGNKNEQAFEKQLQADGPTKWLLTHIKIELPRLRDINNWLDIPAVYIDNNLLQVLYRGAAQKYFPGDCEVYKGLF